MRFTNVSALALAAIPYSFAQTFSDCDPTKKSDCPTKLGLNTAEYTADFTQGSAATADWTTTSGAIDYVAEGGQFSIKALGDGPTMQTNFYMFFGYVEVAMKAAPGAGIVSSFVMESDDLDEIDWEMIGSDAAQVQSNYFGKGNTTTYDRGKFHPVANPQQTMTTYAVNWTQETTTWLINGQPVRTLNFADAVGGQNYPQTPMNVRLGNWVAGDPKNSPGTIEWAGGLADFTKGPFDMTVQSVKIINYNPATSYKYSDMSGTWQSIQMLSDTAQAGAAASGSDNGTTGPGAVPFNSQGVAAAISASQAAGAAQIVTITTGPASQATGAAALSNGTSPNAQAQGAPQAAGSVVSIRLGGQGAAATAGSFSNSTGSGTSGGGLVAAGAPAGGNATNPTVTINPGASGAAAATGGAAGSGITTAPAAANSAQSFGLGAQSAGTASSVTSGPAQVSANPGNKLYANGAAALGALGLGLALI